MHCVCEVLCLCERCGSGVTAALHRKSVLVSVSEGKVCGYSAVSDLGISSVQLLLPSLGTLSSQAGSL